MGINLSLREIQPRELRTENLARSESRENGQADLRVLKSIAEFEEIRDEWSAWADRPEADIDFFSIQLRHKGEAVRPHVMIVNRNGRPNCMLVGWLDRGPVNFNVGPFTFFRSNALIFRFVDGGLLGNQSQENCQFLVREIISSLRRREAQAAEFTQLRVDSPLHGPARREPNIFCREHFIRVENHRYLTLPGSFDEFFRGLHKKTRQRLASHRRMLENDFPGKVRFQSFRSDRDVEYFAAKADEISRETYQRALGAGFVNNPETREILRAAAQKGALRAALLSIGDHPVAYATGILSNRTLYAGFTGYDPAFKKYSPGYQTQVRLIEESFRPSGSIVRFDAGNGDLPYKRALYDSNWAEHPVWIFAPSVRGLSLHVHRAISTLLHSFVLRALGKSHRLRKVKKMWYRRVLRQFQRKGFEHHDEARDAVNLEQRIYGKARAAAK